MSSRIVRNKLGVVTGLTNFKIIEGGLLQMVLPTRNAVIIDFVEGGHSPCISIECKDESMLDQLKEYAQTILNKGDE
jgi:hypothetical protein